jgi:hypothetical protein
MSNKIKAGYYAIYKDDDSPYISFALFDNSKDWLEYNEKNEIKNKIGYRGEFHNNFLISFNPKENDAYTIKALTDIYSDDDENDSEDEFTKSIGKGLTKIKFKSKEDEKEHYKFWKEIKDKIDELDELEKDIPEDVSDSEKDEDMPKLEKGRDVIPWNVYNSWNPKPDKKHYDKVSDWNTLTDPIYIGLIKSNPPVFMSVRKFGEPIDPKMIKDMQDWEKLNPINPHGEIIPDEIKLDIPNANLKLFKRK